MPQIECDTIRDGLLGDTTEFLWSNIIITATSAESRPSNTRIRNFDFSRRDNIKKINVFELVVGDGNNIINGIMPFYFLPWGRDTGYHIVLDRQNGPDIMLTAQLTGCSVGYIKANDGTVRVSHHNLQSSKARMDDDQRKTLSFAGSNAVHPREYSYEMTKTIDHGEESSTKDKTGIAFVYAVRKRDGWHLFKQFVVHTLIRNNFRSGDRRLSWSVVEALEF